MNSAQVRQQLIDALQLDLIGPRPGDPIYARETIPQMPSLWYLAGFLVPDRAPLESKTDNTGDNELDAVSNADAGDDESTPEKTAARKGFFPSSMGLSFLLPREATEVEVTVTWGDYFPLEEETEEETEEITGEGEATEEEKTPVSWKRIPQEVILTLQIKEDTIPLPDTGGLQLAVKVLPLPRHPLLPEGGNSMSVFLTNSRRPKLEKERDMSYVFQTCLSVSCQAGFVARSDLRGQQGREWDEKVADVQYRHDYEYAVGHNTSTIAFLKSRGECYQVQTAWIPQADVEKVVPARVDNVELSMEALGAAATGEEVRRKVGAIATAYTDWIARQYTQLPSDPARADVARELLNRAAKANQRIAAGLAALDDGEVLEAFTIANRAIAASIRQRSCHGSDRQPEDLEPPKWRPFQLAFILMNLAGIIEPNHPDREVVDLLFFPTGGGKTEAYLGLAAFTILLRRLRNKGNITGAGLSVIMRYTLRLLTLDQLGRAATLICALELERQKQPEKLGEWPIEIGLWVGQTATPNVMGRKGDKNQFSARARTNAFKNDSQSKPSPIPLENCPWCGENFSSNSFELKPNADYPTNLKIKCSPARKARKSKDKTPPKRSNCDFRRNNFLPILAVDEPIYRRLPSIIIATVDKFASLPWVGETGALFGKVNRYDSEGFYGYADTKSGGYALEKNLLPPELIIQDELHLISGPLGTMVGLYETAIEALASYELSEYPPRPPLKRGEEEGKIIKPKIIASTATVRRAEKQILGLFGRQNVEIFPPSSPDRRDSFFAQTVDVTVANARKYIGIAAPGRSLKVVLLRSYLALLSAAQKAYQEEGGKKNKNNPADPYMTLLGYFNSLRELGGSRRIVEDEINSSLTKRSQRRRVGEAERGMESLFGDRKINDEPRELTSRESTDKVAETKRRLALTFENEERVDVALATNMISVGLDISRLGLMVVLGQPKTAAEYIQATSRVGRDDERPGLVVTLLNVHRPRDRSHYERFPFWHTIFYRAVEATSVTPFSPRAIDRGIAAPAVAIARLGHPELTAALAAGDIIHHRQKLEEVIETICRRAENQAPPEAAAEVREKVREQVADLLDSWVKIAEEQKRLQYQKEEDLAGALLQDPLDPELRKKSLNLQKFAAQRSLRDVEPAVNLWVRTPGGGDVETE